MDVVIVRSHNITYDSRVEKIVRSLNKKYSITALGWNRKNMSKELIRDYVSSFKLFNFKAPLGSKLLVAYLPFFWIWTFFNLVILRPKVVHACDLDTFLPCFIYKLFFKKKLVFDVFDRYAMANIPRNFTLLYLTVTSFEEWCSKCSDVLITTSPKFLESFKKKPKHNIVVLNCSEDRDVTKVPLEKNMLTLVYTGPIVRNRGIEKIREAIKELKGVEFTIAGWILDQEFLDEILTYSNIKYKGLLLPIDALSLEGNSDVMVSLYNLKILNYNFAIPNKTFEAMMLGLPVITNITPNIIKERECGIMVDYEDLDQIRFSIIQLRDNIELRKKLGGNGRKAFEQKYNWTMMEQELYKIYNSLLKD